MLSIGTPIRPARAPGRGVSVLRRVALGFPLTWSHRRAYGLESLSDPGRSPYFIEWDPGNGAYGEDWTNAPRDSRGVLLSGHERYYHAIRIAQFALHRFGIWHRTADVAARKDFLAQAAWLRDCQQNDGIPGTYRFAFPWHKYGAGVGWASAMAQGEAISVLLRAHGMQKDAGFDAAALRAAQPFRADIDGGGVVWKSGEDVFFEEVANRHAPHILNGCVYALWGVWELWQLTGEPWLGEISERCVQTVLRWLPRFDTGWWTLYSLLHSSTRRPHIATLKYHEFHITQMRVLSKMFDEPSFDDAAVRWTAYTETSASRRRLLGETLGSLPERFFKLDTVSGGATT
jgi:heparosan-N-sulfate-glucuronate 5-epimerase